MPWPTSTTHPAGHSRGASPHRVPPEKLTGVDVHRKAGRERIQAVLTWITPRIAAALDMLPPRPGFNINGIKVDEAATVANATPAASTAAAVDNAIPTSMAAAVGASKPTARSVRTVGTSKPTAKSAGATRSGKKTAHPHKGVGGSKRK